MKFAIVVVMLLDIMCIEEEHFSSPFALQSYENFLRYASFGLLNVVEERYVVV